MLFRDETTVNLPSYRLSRLSWLLSLTGVVTLAAYCVVVSRPPIVKPENAVAKAVATGRVTHVRMRFVANGAEEYDRKKERGNWFDLPLDVWGSVEPIAAAAEFYVTLKPEKTLTSDLAEVVLELDRGEAVTLSILSVVENCSCFIFRNGRDAFLYENLDKQITSNFLSHVAMEMFAEFQDGDSAGARDRASKDLEQFARLASRIPKGKD